MGLGPAKFAERVAATPPAHVEPIGSGKSGALLAVWPDDLKAVVKLAKEALPNGKKAQRGILIKDHPRRELAFYQLAEAFGWDDLVPKVTLFTLKGKEASAQAFIPADHLKVFNKQLKSRENPRWVSALKSLATEVPKSSWLKLVLLDLVAGSRDRHANNVGLRILFEGDKAVFRLVAWDNPVAFGTTFRLYHQVFHKFLFRKTFHVDPVWEKFSSLRKEDLRVALSGLVSDLEVEHAWLRYQFAVDFPYRLPWEMMSHGSDLPSSFPAHADFFERRMQDPEALAIAT